jgi:hypothetical protein
MESRAQCIEMLAIATACYEHGGTNDAWKKAFDEKVTSRTISQQLKCTNEKRVERKEVRKLI